MGAVTPRKSLEPFLSDAVEYYKHQVDGVRWLARHRNFLLADDMGTGKSLQALTTFIIDVKRGWCNTCLIVCPTTLKGNWKDEIEKFTTIPATILEGTPFERTFIVGKFALQKGPRILIANYEQVPSMLEMLNGIKFDVLILDEAHQIKNSAAVRTKAVLQLYSHRTFVLTGTPMLNRITELFPLLHRIDPKAFPSQGKFNNRYVVWGGEKGKTIVGVKNEGELIERLSHVMLRRLKSEVLDLPEVNPVTRVIDLYEEQQAIYTRISEDMMLPRADAEDEEIEHVFAVLTRLKQLCGSTFEFNGEDISSKLDTALVDDASLIENDEKIVVFTQFKSILDLYVQRLQRFWPDLPVFVLTGSVKQEDRIPMTKRWASVTGSAVFVSMLQVGGVGLNLTASKNVSFLDELWTPGLNQQAIDRVHRIGADLTQPVTVRRYLCRGTIEFRVQQILKEKSGLISGIIENSPNWKRKLVDALRMEEEGLR